MTTNRRSFAAGSFSLVALGFAATAFSQAAPYPNKPIRIIVPYAPGGGTDIVGRILASKMSDGLGQQVVVENKPGANSMIGASYVAKTPPDGYTLMIGPTGTMAVNPAVYSDLPYNALNDFAPVSLVATGPMLLIVPANLPVRNIKELVAHVLANQATANYASSGTVYQLMGVYFSDKTNAKINNIPYKGTAESVTAVVSGQVMMGFVDSTPVVALAKAGRVRVLAVTSATRHPSFPDVPTLIEEGVTDREVQLWSGVFASAGTPEPIVNRLHRELERAVAMPDVRERLSTLGVEAVSSTPAALRQLVESDVKLWSEMAKKANMKLTVS